MVLLVAAAVIVLVTGGLRAEKAGNALGVGWWPVAVWDIAE